MITSDERKQNYVLRYAWKTAGSNWNCHHMIESDDQNENILFLWIFFCAFFEEIRELLKSMCHTFI